MVAGGGRYPPPSRHRKGRIMRKHTWIVRRHVAGGDVDTVHATLGEARRAEREAIMAARTYYGIAYSITLFRERGRS